MKKPGREGQPGKNGRLGATRWGFSQSDFHAAAVLAGAAGNLDCRIDFGGPETGVNIAARQADIGQFMIAQIDQAARGYAVSQSLPDIPERWNEWDRCKIGKIVSNCRVHRKRRVTGRGRAEIAGHQSIHFLDNSLGFLAGRSWAGLSWEDGSTTQMMILYRKILLISLTNVFNDDDQFC